MIELERHIEILLLSNDCVIVPNFGGFMAHHAEAYYDERDHTFIPPRRTLGFNPQLKINDSLLAQSYIEAYDISYPDAVKRIDDEVCELKSHLANKGYYAMNDIGVLRTNEEGSIEFEPCEAGILTPSLYGLGSFELPSIADCVETAETTETAAKVVTLNPVTETATTATVNNNQETKVVPINIWRNIAVACIVFIAFLLMPSDINTGNGLVTTAGKIDTELLYRIMPRSVTTEMPATVVAKPSVTAAPAEKPAEVKPAVQKEAMPYYTVVFASKVNKDNAQSFAESLKKQGFKDSHVLEKTNNTQVVCGHFSTEAEAYAQMKEMSKKGDYQDLWVTTAK